MLENLPEVVTRPITSWPSLPNQMAPSGPAVKTVGSALKGMAYVVTTPLGVMVPMNVSLVSLEAKAMENHRFPLGPSVMPHR